MQVPYIKKPQVSILAIGHIGLEVAALRNTLESFGYLVDTRWIGSKEEVLKVLRGEIHTSDLLIISCHGGEEGILMNGEPPLSPSDIKAHCRLKDKVIISTGCLTGRHQLSQAFSDQNKYIGPSDYVDGNSCLMFIYQLFHQLYKKVTLEEAVRHAKAIDSDTNQFVLFQNKHSTRIPTGIIILTGPSNCGKGALAKVLRTILDLPKDNHLSMGNILRDTIRKARRDATFRKRLSDNYQISDDISIFDKVNPQEVTDKAKRYSNDLNDFYEKNKISQLDWLEYCVTRGLLIPDSWTESLINEALETRVDSGSQLLILDGYPRTTKAAEALLTTCNQLKIPIVKVIHLSISKGQMMTRAQSRKRLDDDIKSLERRYDFYTDKVQTSLDYLKDKLGYDKVALIDAHQPSYYPDGGLDLDQSIKNVAKHVFQALEKELK